MDDAFRELYPATPNAVLARRYGVAVVTVNRWARRLGLRKSAEHRRSVQAANARRRRLTSAQKAHLSEIARGRRPRPEAIEKALRTKRERGTILRGSTHPFWKGGHPWQRFKDPAYLAWRKAVLERDGYRCQECGRQCKKYEKGLAAHHIKDYATHTELRLEIDNGVTLCRDCHMKLHGKTVTPMPLVRCACGCGVLIAPVDAYGRSRRYVNYHASRLPRGGRRWTPITFAQCACGCGTPIASHDAQGRPRTYVNHHARGRPMSAEARERLSRQRKGKSFPPEFGARVRDGLRRSTKRIGRPPKRSIKEDGPRAA